MTKGAFQKLPLKDYFCRYHFDPLQNLEVASLSLSSWWGHLPDYRQVSDSPELHFSCNLDNNGTYFTRGVNK